MTQEQGGHIKGHFCVQGSAKEPHALPLVLVQNLVLALQGKALQCSMLLLPVDSYLGRAEPTSGTQSCSLGVTETQNVI